MLATIALGGHLRVGLEDNVMYGKDENGRDGRRTPGDLYGVHSVAVQVDGQLFSRSRDIRCWTMGMP